MAVKLEELRKAIQVSTGGGAALVPYELDPILHEELIKNQPLLELLEVKQAESKTHEYNIRSSHPQAWFEGETTPANAKASAYQRKSVALKIMRIWGGVSGFAQTVDQKFIDALEAELTGSVQGMADVIEWSTLFGAADDITFTGDAYQYSGILPRIFKYAPTNVVDAGGDKISLDDLDAALAKINIYRRVRSDPKLFMMSTRMKQIVDGLQTKVQLPLQSMELFDGKLVMASYEGVPIFESEMVYPATASSSPTDLAATESGAGTLPADQYFYNISSITLDGEQIVGTEANVTTTGGNDAVVLTWTADTNAFAYFIWRGLTTGNANMQLLDVIPGKTYDAAGTVNGSLATYTDTGAKTPIAVKPLSTGEQQIVLVNRSLERGAAFIGKIDDMGRQLSSLVSFVELARVKDSYDYMLKSYQALRLIYPNLAVVIRHAKLA